jgi:uncharacterized Zn finger protein (UPF0148 family)
MKFRCPECGTVKTIGPLELRDIGNPWCPTCNQEQSREVEMTPWSAVSKKIKKNTDPHLKNRLLLARAVKKAIAVYEDSWDEHACKYTKDLESCITSAFLHGQVDPQLSRIFYLAAIAWWQDSIAWANYVLKEVDNA